MCCIMLTAIEPNQNPSLQLYGLDTTKLNKHAVRVPTLIGYDGCDDAQNALTCCLESPWNLYGKSMGFIWNHGLVIITGLVYIQIM